MKKLCEMTKEERENEERKTAFIEYLKSKNYKDIITYPNDVKLLASHLKKAGYDQYPSDFYELCDAAKAEKIKQEINKIDFTKEILTKMGISKSSIDHAKSAFNKYIEFLNSYGQNDYYTAVSADKADESTAVIRDLKPNMLFYGVPGAGKSHYIKNTIIGNDKYERVVFHPDYTYSDFVGQILPKRVGNDITYDFIPGPFTKILKEALKPENDNKKFFLVIEEINRGNAPAIFGDIFQLLDRNKDYEITNSEIAKAIEHPNEKIYLPANLYILATMNTSDQNVFTLDTAFKRRWAMRCIKNRFDECTFADENISGNESKITWGAFANVINNAIVDAGSGISGEDKRLGAFFIKKDDLDRVSFGEKVLMYLWDDAFKYNRDVFQDKYKSLESVLDDFEEHGFVENVLESGTDTLNTDIEDNYAEDENEDDETEITEEAPQNSIQQKQQKEVFYVFKEDIIKEMLEKSKIKYYDPKSEAAAANNEESSITGNNTDNEISVFEKSILADFNLHLKKAGKNPVTSINKLNELRSKQKLNIQQSNFYGSDNLYDWYDEIDRENGGKLILTNDFTEYKGNQEQKKAELREYLNYKKPEKAEEYASLLCNFFDALSEINEVKHFIVTYKSKYIRIYWDKKVTHFQIDISSESLKINDHICQINSKPIYATIVNNLMSDPEAAAKKLAWYYTTYISPTQQQGGVVQSAFS